MKLQPSTFYAVSITKTTSSDNIKLRNKTNKDKISENVYISQNFSAKFSSNDLSLMCVYVGGGQN